jgi:DNA modification methylase
MLKYLDALVKKVEVRALNRLFVYKGDANVELGRLQPKTVDCVFCSPTPVFYYEGVTGIGGEESIEQYISNLVKVFDKVDRVLKDTGSLFINIGDYHHDEPGGTLLCIPERFILAMREKGWIFRSRIIWHRTNDNIEQDNTRWKVDYEYILFFTKTPNYNFIFSDFCKSSVIHWQTDPVKDGEFSTGFPIELIDKFLKSVVPEDGVVLDPFAGTGSTGVSALRNGFYFVGIELHEPTAKKMYNRLRLG